MACRTSSHLKALVPGIGSDLRFQVIHREASVSRTQWTKRTPSISCRSSLTTPGQSPDATSQQNLDKEWMLLGLSYISEDCKSQLDDEWMRLGLSVPPPAAGAPAAYTPEDLDDIWLQLGLTFTDVESPSLTQEPEGAEPLSSPKTTTPAAASAVVESKPEVEAVRVTPEVDPKTYFATDLRPIVLFDGSCNFCSKWTVFLLDTDPKGNLRFASMQSEAGKAFLRRAGMKESNTSEIVLAAYNRSYIGSDAILQIFSRLELPFPIIAAVGSVMPSALNNAVYKLVSKYRHRFGGPAACRLFDPRFNERFVA